MAPNLKSVEGLRSLGFDGFIRFSDLAHSDIPEIPGVYAVVWDGADLPPVAEASIGGWFKGKDPSVVSSEATARLIPGVQLLYVGKAGIGSRGNRSLRTRTKEFRDFGQGKPVGHWGGRLIWQIQHYSQLLIGWKVILEGDPEIEEKTLLRAFKEEFGQLPYANLRL